jgi:hypothetical protein
MTRIYMELKKLNSPKINDPVMKWVNELNRVFSKDKLQMAKKHMRKCSCHKGNANQKHVKIPPLSYYHQEHKQQQMLARTFWGKRNPDTLLVGI